METEWLAHTADALETQTRDKLKILGYVNLGKRRQIKIELNRSTHSRLTVQFVSIVAGSAILDPVASQLIGDAVSGSALEVVRRFAVQTHGRRTRTGVLYLGPHNAEALLDARFKGHHLWEFIIMITLTWAPTVLSLVVKLMRAVWPVEV